MKKMKTAITFCVLFTLPFLAAATPFFSDDPLVEQLGWFANFGSNYEGYAETYRNLVEMCDKAGLDGRRRVFDASIEMVAWFEDFAKRTGQETGSRVGTLCLLMGASGDRAFLPWLEERSFRPDSHRLTRNDAAKAYIRLADMDERVAFVRKRFEARQDPGDWDSIFRDVLDKVSAEEGSIGSGTLDALYTFLLEIVQDAGGPDTVNTADRFLLKHLPGYADSRQRATLERFTVTNSAWNAKFNARVTNTFNPVKAHFDAIPPSERTDLRIRYPGLPPLPDDLAEASASAARRVWLITTAVGVAALAAAIALALLRRAKKAGTA